ncbi:MAG: hypothetical protein IJ774_08835 [Selenomonadaceae bacterium]|nr:hypothetical protein [Selenomonadaceae bacterium]
MSKIFRNPLTPEQLKASQTISDAKIRQAQDGLFMYLLNRVAELESKLEQQNAGKLHIRNIK